MDGYLTLCVRAGGGRSEACRSVAPLAMGPTQLGGCRGAGWSAGSSRAAALSSGRTRGVIESCRSLPSRTPSQGLAGA